MSSDPEKVYVVHALTHVDDYKHRTPSRSDIIGVYRDTRVAHRQACLQYIKYMHENGYFGEEETTSDTGDNDQGQSLTIEHNKRFVMHNRLSEKLAECDNDIVRTFFFLQGICEDLYVGEFIPCAVFQVFVKATNII